MNDQGSTATSSRIRRIIDVNVEASSYQEATRLICGWAQEGASRYVCACNVHMVMEAHDDPDFREVVNGADLVVPDGMPLVWALKALGLPHASRVYGPQLMLEVLEEATRSGIPNGLHGGTPATLDALTRVLESRWPDLRIAYRHSPPFGPVSYSNETLRGIRESGVRILFVALGCPKQERWMYLHKESLPAVMVGVGAAFDFIAGRIPQAPSFLQHAGLEWAFRLSKEPKRLWRRYAVHNPRFIGLMARQLAGRTR